MELKKSKDASIENLRAPIVFIGFLFIGSLVLASFSYSSAIEEEDNGDGEKRSTAIKYSQEEKKEDTPPPPTPLDQLSGDPFLRVDCCHKNLI